MKLLLDTHTFIWFDLEPMKLSTGCRGLLLDQDNILLLSMASIWEMQIKFQLGKLTLRLPLPELLEEQKRMSKIQILPIELQHIWALAGLPNHHRDPFDRLLLAQSIAEELTIVSNDENFDAYPVQRLW
jgi:PIN domain nuclease of toxin-antitoxin system